MAQRQHNFIYLLAGLLFLLLAIPLLRDLAGITNHYITGLAFSTFLIIGVWSLHGVRRIFLLGIVLVILGVGSNILELTGAGAPFAYLSLSSYIIFLLLTISLAIRQVIYSTIVDANSIIGAICIYLLLGVIWSFFYVIVNIFIPNSFNVQIDGTTFAQQQSFLYLSFITLTTVGYGDIVPIGATARALSTIEAILGQFYIAILVAGLVAAFITQKSTQNNQN